MNRTLDLTARLYKALAHPARLRILAMLRGGELCACQITAVLGLAASTVSAHLAELRRAGLVNERKQGRWVYYALSGDSAVGTALRSVWAMLETDSRVASDRHVLTQLRSVPVEALCRAGLDLTQLAISRKPDREKTRR